MPSLFAPVCSITTTKRRRFFWAAWWSSPPRQVPFQRPDASDGGAATYDEALRAAEHAAGVPLSPTDSMWARAWLRILRGGVAWPSAASRRPAGESAPRADVKASALPLSVWDVLGVTPSATSAELKAAFRARVLEAHPDQGGDDAALRRVVAAYAEARRRLRRPRRSSA